MKTKLQLFAVFVIAAVAALFAQGPLTPPGAPAPTMKSLDQIEARTPISSAPFTIAQSGSYYLTANLNVANGTAITIAANNVTLDLNGFKISSTAFGGGTGSAILIQSAKNVAIYNGHIEGREVFDNAFLHGINSSNSPINVRVTDVSVFGCGMHGIQLGDDVSTVVERCTVDLVGAEGIRAGIVSHSTAKRCGGNGIVAQNASDCYAASSAGKGLSANVAANCTGASADGVGIDAFTAQNCYGTGAGLGFGDGIYARMAINCRGVSTAGSGSGIIALIASNCEGTASSKGGISANVVQNCIGTSTGTGTSGVGILASSAAENCYAYGSYIALDSTAALNCYGQSTSGIGLRGLEAATNCFGASITGTGISAGNASNCRGQSSGSGTGLAAAYTASYCSGVSNTGIGVSATIAIGCTASSVSATTLKYLMPGGLP